MIKKLLTTAAAIFLFASTANADIDTKKAEEFVKKVTSEGIEELVNSNAPQAEKDEKFAKLFNEDLDLKFIGQFVLGRYWKTATPKQKEEFINVYRELNIKTWSKRFDEFKGKKFVFHGTKPSSSKNQVFVDSVVPMDQGNPAAVVWRVKQDGNTFKIVDIIIENVSLAITARNEYSAFVKNSPEGVDGLIKHLRTMLETQ